MGKFTSANLADFGKRCPALKMLSSFLLLATAVIACTAAPTPTPAPPPSATAQTVGQVTTAPTDGYPQPTGYPIATHPAVVDAYPVSSPTAELIFTPAPVPTLGSAHSDLFLPLAMRPPEATPTPVATAVPSATPFAAIDYSAVRTELAAQGLAISPVKIGFHTGIDGNIEGLEDWMRALDAAGIPFFLKSVDNAEPIYIAQEMMKRSGVPHVLVYRKAAGGSYDWNVPNYSLPPEQAAEIHWQMHRDAFPPELDRSLVWLETMNEVDKTVAEWLGQFALKTAEFALDEGFRWAAFGWASGEPEPTDWQTPSMLAFLRLAGDNPDQLAIALHEYSYLLDDIGHEYPYKLGRFQSLLQIVDQQGIPRPTILITEWGWTYVEVPSPERAMHDIAWASQLYAAYPEVKGAAIWFLGGQFENIANLAQRLIKPMTQYSLQNYFTAPLPPARAPVRPEAFQP